jgi:hypothetical protein
MASPSALRQIEDALIAAGFPIARASEGGLPLPRCWCGRDLFAHLGARLPRGCPGWRPRRG